MKYITKKGAPHDYRNWCNANKGSENEDYRCLQNPEKASLHKTLVSEQGGLCAYTMRRITTNSSHIEHIKPESLCREDDKKIGGRGSDLDYKNMVACSPKEGMINPYRYGAHEKGDWWEDEGRDFVSPLDGRCEKRFSFNSKGEIEAVGGDKQAKTTIDVLKLNHPSLTEDRERAIREFIYGQDGDGQPSITKATQEITTVCDKNKADEYREFCVAIKHGLAEYIEDLKKATKKRKIIKAQQQKRN